MTEKDIIDICELRENGKTYKWIAEKYGVSVGCIQYHCYKNLAERECRKTSQKNNISYFRKGRKVNAFTKQEDLIIQELRKKGLGVCAIGRQLNRPHNSITLRLITLSRWEEVA
jgi:DNA-binding NarL/FixJ family response regulator